MTCRIITSSWNYIDVIRLDSAATDVLVARVNGSLITHPFSPRITASVTGGNVVVDFTTIQCDDAGTYLCVLNATTGRIQSPTSDLHVRRPPSLPVLHLKGHQVVGSTVNYVHKHTCTGDVGYPAGEFKVQYAPTGSSVFTDISVSNTQTSPSDWLCNSTERTYIIQLIAGNMSRVMDMFCVLGYSF
ncbi:uncharacterized protein LOC110456326 [Mizuhopecten yessoensis]|uniref:uncharacterized protein LOC110456326 n=1 Tax=Mizuhopecten yessoensis TaxID=6573 RepID=UPI000B45A952|nr:uncharacterized protein LOC110456326 [Mizuhopecten yessoensis]